jgi:hypothetical protein
MYASNYQKMTVKVKNSEGNLLTSAAAVQLILQDELFPENYFQAIRSVCRRLVLLRHSPPICCCHLVLLHTGCLRQKICVSQMFLYLSASNNNRT